MGLTGSHGPLASACPSLDYEALSVPASGRLRIHRAALSSSLTLLLKWLSEHLEWHDAYIDLCPLQLSVGQPFTLSQEASVVRGDDTGSDSQLLGARVLGMVEALGPGASAPTQGRVLQLGPQSLGWSRSTVGLELADTVIEAQATPNSAFGVSW